MPTPAEIKEAREREQIKRARELQQALEELDATRRLGIATQEELLELEKAVVAAQLEYGRTIQAADSYLDSYRTQLKALTAELETLKEETESYERAVTAGQQAQEKLFQGFLKTNTSVGQMANTFKATSARDLPGLAKGFFSLGGGLARLQELGVKVVDMFAEFGIQQDKVLANFRAQTGAGNEFNDVIRDTALANLQAGVSLEESAAAVRALKNEYTDFTYLSEAQQGAIAETTTLLNKLGFSFSTQASVIQTATQAMGMDVNQANDLLVDLASTAKSLGVDVDVLGQQFAQNADFLVRFGEDGQEVFEEMAVAAKALGAELGTLIKLTDKFKTFDEAGRAVGRFNAILGGPYLNSIDMLNAAYEDPIEGIKMLREGFEQAGMSVEDLSGAELEAFASALGLSTEETVKMLGKSNEELEIQRMNQEELEETALKAQDSLTQLSNAFKQLLADARPFIDNVLVPMFEALSSVAQFLGDAESAMSRFVRIGLAAAGIGALIAAPFTGGTSLAVFAGVSAAAGIGMGMMSSSGGGGGAGAAAAPHFATGGTITTPQAVVHPGEMLITGGQGTEVVSQKDFKELLDGLKKMTDKGNMNGSPIQLAVYVGQEKIDEVVVNALNSPAGKRVMSPYSMV